MNDPGVWSDMLSFQTGANSKLQLNNTGSRVSFVAL